MNQAEATKLVSRLRFNLKDRRNLKSPQGPAGRHDKIRKTVTALFKYERLELLYGRADESRGYAERLISDAIRYGENHKETMKMASYWILEKPIIHKLFKVLVPRYKNCQVSYTRMWRAPPYPDFAIPKAILELRNNVFPPLGAGKEYNKNLIHNVLLTEAKKAFEKEKASKLNLDTSINNSVKKSDKTYSVNEITESKSDKLPKDFTELKLETENEELSQSKSQGKRKAASDVDLSFSGVKSESSESNLQEKENAIGDSTELNQVQDSTKQK